MSLDTRCVYEFTQNEVWTLIQALLDGFIGDCRDILESNGPYPTEGTERFTSNAEVRGALKTLRRMKTLPIEVHNIVSEANENHIDALELIINQLKEEV